MKWGCWSKHGKKRMNRLCIQRHTDRFGDGWDIGGEGKRGKLMDQRLPIFIPERKWSHFTNEKIRSVKYVVWTASLALNMLMLWSVGEKSSKNVFKKIKEKYGISFRVRDLVLWGLHFRKYVEWPLSEPSK